MKFLLPLFSIIFGLCVPSFSQRTLPEARSLKLNSIAHLAGSKSTLLVCGESGYLAISHNLGTSWAKLQSPTSVNLNKIVPTGGRFMGSLICGDNGILLEVDSTGGYQSIQTGLSVNLNDAMCSGDAVGYHAIVVGNGGKAVYVRDSLGSKRVQVLNTGISDNLRGAFGVYNGLNGSGFPFEFGSLIFLTDSNYIYRADKSYTDVAWVMSKIRTDTVSPAPLSSYGFNGYNSAMLYSKGGHVVRAFGLEYGAKSRLTRGINCSYQGINSSVMSAYRANNYNGCFSVGPKGRMYYVNMREHQDTFRTLTCSFLGTERNLNSISQYFNATDRLLFHFAVGDSGVFVTSYKPARKGLNIYAKGPTAICRNSVVVITDTMLNNSMRIQWYMNGNPIPGANKPYVEVKQAAHITARRFYAEEVYFPYNGNGSESNPKLYHPQYHWAGDTSNTVVIRLSPLTPNLLIDGLSVRNTVTDSANFKFHWYRNGVKTKDTTAILTHPFSGYYRLVVENRRGCRSDSSNLVLYVRCDSLSRVVSPNKDTSSCVFGPYKLSYNYTMPFKPAFKWLRNGYPINTQGANSTADFYMVTNDSARYSLRIEVGNCVVVTQPVMINVKTNQEIPKINGSPAEGYCKGSPKVTYSTRYRPGYTYEWLANFRLVSTDTFISFDTSTVGIKLRVKTPKGCMSTFISARDVFFIDPPGQPMIVNRGSTVLAVLANAHPRLRYRFVYNGQVYQDSPDNVVFNAPNGNWSVTAYLGNCVSPSSVDYVMTSIGKSLSLEKLNVYPVPATEVLHFTVENEPMPYEIYDMRGRRVLSGQSQTGENTLSITTLSPGRYLLRLGHRQYAEFVRE